MVSIPAATILAAYDEFALGIITPHSFSHFSLVYFTLKTEMNISILFRMYFDYCSLGIFHASMMLSLLAEDNFTDKTQQS